MNIFRGKNQILQFANNLKEKRVLTVFDVNTEQFSFCVTKMLKNAKKEVRSYKFFDKHLVPEISILTQLMSLAKEYDYILAVGSGTINDVCKYVSSKSDVPYGILATAPSMDGYVSSVSALYDNGKKVTLPTSTPSDVLIDLDILKNAPIDMIVAGAGDMIGKYTSLLDWKFANVFNGEKYDRDIVERMYNAVKLCISQARELVNRNESAISALIEGLILSGIEMQNAGNSRPASGCEHHISHYLEMWAEGHGKHQFAPHGVQVALGSLVGNLLYRYAVEQNFEGIALVHEDVARLPAVEELTKLYDDIGLPTTFAQIGVDESLLMHTIANAYTVRERFTIMSFLKKEGALEKASKLIAPIL